MKTTEEGTTIPQHRIIGTVAFRLEDLVLQANNGEAEPSQYPPD